MDVESRQQFSRWLDILLRQLTLSVACFGAFLLSANPTVGQTLPDAPYVVRIERDDGHPLYGAVPGHLTSVDVTLDKAASGISRFNFLIAYNDTLLRFSTASAGDALVAHGWEYFQYSSDTDIDCSDDCPSGLVRVIAIAAINDGPNPAGLHQ